LIHGFLFKYKKGETEYGVGWLPTWRICLKISGMIDESMDKEQMKTSCSTMGIQVKKHHGNVFDNDRRVIFNFIFAILIFILVFIGLGRKHTCQRANVKNE